MPAPEYLAQLTDMLHRQQTPAGDIERYRRHYDLLGLTRDVPCPYCYLGGGPKGELATLNRLYGLHRMVCRTCKREFAMIMSL